MSEVSTLPPGVSPFADALAAAAGPRTLPPELRAIFASAPVIKTSVSYPSESDGGPPPRYVRSMLARNMALEFEETMAVASEWVFAERLHTSKARIIALTEAELAALLVRAFEAGRRGAPR